MHRNEWCLFDKGSNTKQQMIQMSSNQEMQYHVKTMLLLYCLDAAE